MKRHTSLERFEAKFVESGPLLEQAQVLRRKAFFNDSGKDEDAFDAFCIHIVIIDKETQKVVGTYRLLLGSVAEKNIGFYAETKFNIANIKKNCQGELLEMGRACVDEAYRRFPIINIMWQAIDSYVQAHNVQYVFGSSSVAKPSALKVGQLVKFFKENYYADSRFQVYPWEEAKYPYLKEASDFDEHTLWDAVPSLLRNYFKIGARVCGEPAWNKVFDTAIFFMMLNVKEMNNLYKDKVI